MTPVRIIGVYLERNEKTLTATGHSFGNLRFVITSPTGEDLDVRIHDMARFGYQLSGKTRSDAITIDLARRIVTEEDDARLTYQIFEGDDLLLTAYTDATSTRYYEGGGERCRAGAVLTGFFLSFGGVGQHCSTPPSISIAFIV